MSSDPTQPTGQVDLFGLPVAEPSAAPPAARPAASAAAGARPSPSPATAGRTAPRRVDAVEGPQTSLIDPADPSPGAAGDAADHDASPDQPRGQRRRKGGVQPAPALETDKALAAALSPRIRLGGSSWSYPGWQGQVWAGEHSEAVLARQGLAAYAQHPLMRAVSIDRGFYQSLTASQFERYALMVPDDFRFTVKAPSVVTDALVRAEDGRGRQANEAFLNGRLALDSFVTPAFEGLGSKIGALVFQLSPLPLDLLARMPEQLDRLWAMLKQLPAAHARPSGAMFAVEVRDPEWLTPDFVALLRDVGACYCLGLHPKLPPISEQLPVLRALWPGPLMVRWNLHRRHGPFGYEEAERRYGPYDRMVDPDVQTREMLAKVMQATADAGHEVLVTISNHAEGSAPLSVRALAEAVRERASAEHGREPGAQRAP